MYPHCRCSKIRWLNIEVNKLISNLAYIFFGAAFMYFVRMKSRFIAARKVTGSVFQEAVVQPMNGDVVDVEEGPVGSSASDVPEAVGHPDEGDAVLRLPRVSYHKLKADEEAVINTYHVSSNGSAHREQEVSSGEMSRPQDDLQPIADTVGKETGVMQQFGIYSSLGLSLIFQGVFSICYHVCPTNHTLQFDTTVMYIICILAIIKIYQVRTQVTNGDQSHKGSQPWSSGYCRRPTIKGS